jgi:hypothetical protein
MKLVKDLNIIDFFNLINHTVHFTSDCEFFPNFDVTCKVLTIAYNGSEHIFKVQVDNKEIEIGANMKNLKYELCE